MLGTELTQWAHDLGAALDIPTELDARDLILPGILVTPGPIDFNRLNGDTAAAQLELWLVAGDTNPKVALDELTAMLLKLRDHMDGEPSTAEPMTLTLSAQSPDGLPALRCPITLDISFA